MLICTFAGDRTPFAIDMADKIDAALEEITKIDSEFLFYSSGLNDFDKLCSARLREIKQKHAELQIRLVLARPKTPDNVECDGYDAVTQLEGLSGESAEGINSALGRWMIDQSDVLLAYVRGQAGAANETLQYAKKQLNLLLINLAEKI